VLFRAKINSLDSLRRESISTDDAASPQAQTDYTSRRSVTNELAVMAPYDITFRCFSSELAGVLAGFGGSPYSMIVKTIVVEPSVSGGTLEEGQPGGTPAMTPPAGYTPPPAYSTPAAERAMADRYGVRPGGGGRGGEGGPGGVTGGIPERGLGQPGVTPNPYSPAYNTPTASPGGVASATSSRGGLPTVLDEKQLKVTLSLDVVKLTPAK
jgi:hypothetical protein